MATLDELTQRPDLTNFSMHITKTLVSSVAAAGATAAEAAVAAAVAEVCVSGFECACVCTYAQI